MRSTKSGPMIKHRLVGAPRATERLARTKFDADDLGYLDEAIAKLCTNGCTRVPGLAHARNKVAARLGAQLMTGAEDDALEAEVAGE